MALGGRMLVTKDSSLSTPLASVDERNSWSVWITERVEGRGTFRRLKETKGYSTKLSGLDSVTWH